MSEEENMDIGNADMPCIIKCRKMSG